MTREVLKRWERLERAAPLLDEPNQYLVEREQILQALMEDDEPFTQSEQNLAAACCALSNINYDQAERQLEILRASMTKLRDRHCFRGQRKYGFIERVG